MSRELVVSDIGTIPRDQHRNVSTASSEDAFMMAKRELAEAFEW